MLRFLQTAFIFGEGAEVIALNTLLSLFLPETMSFRLDDVEMKMKEVLAKAHEILVVILSPNQHEGFVQSLINPIMLLRFQLQWRGAILLIADSTELHHLQKLALFNLLRGSRYAAQIGLERPISVGRLFSALSRLRPYSESAWQALHSTVQHWYFIRKAWSLYREAENEFALNRWPAEQFKQWTQIMADISAPEKILIGHDSRHALSDFLCKYRNPGNRGEVLPEDRKAVVELLRKIMKGIPRAG